MPRFRRSIFALLAVAGAAAVQAAPTIPLPSGQPRTFNLPGGAFTNSFYIDVPASSQRLTLQLTGGAGAGDIDLLLSSAAPFPDQIGGNTPTFEQLSDAAQYRSLSVESNERLSISRANVFPVRAGRWYVSVINFSPSTPANPTITATLSDALPGPVPIEVVFNDATSSDPESPCRIAEWNDPTPRAPVAGNTGTTLGAQRQNALREAVRIIGTEIKSDVPIRLQACWDNLGTGTSFTLAQAGPRTLTANDPWLPKANTWFAIGPATKLGGATQCALLGGSCNVYDIRATFNNQVDTNAITSNYYYGFGGPAGFGDSDFIGVALHEISHGLGFISTVNTRASEGPVGQLLRADNGVFYDDAFGHNLIGLNADLSLNKRFMDMSDAERAAAITSGGLLRWDESRAVNSQFNAFAGFTPPGHLIRMHTPNPVVPGSSLSHVGGVHSGELMRAQAAGSPRNLTLAGPMLEAVGWSSAPQGAAIPLPASNNLFDSRRDGHGIDFVRVRDNIYALTFYTYGANGEPEWFQAVGTVTNGVFTPIVDANGKSLIRYRYNPANQPPQTPVSAESGTVALDFNNAASQAPCNDGRVSTNAVAVMTFSLGADQNVRWCMEPIVSATARPLLNFSGLWFAGNADDGWGWSVLNFTAGATTSTYGLLFYYDAMGNPVWSYSLHNGVSANTATPLVHRRAYCRTCATTAFTDRNAGTVTFGFTTPSESPAANNRVNYESTPQNAVGGRFARTNSPFVLLTTPQ